MTTVIYDSSFYGFLTAIFEIYEYKFQQPVIYKENKVATLLFGVTHSVFTNVEKAKRVFEKLQRKLSADALMQIHAAFLSEDEGVENTLLRYIQYAINTGKNIEEDYSNTDVLIIQQISRKTCHEAHRFKGFVRFQQAGDGLYFSIIEPDHNILPMITLHFRERFADQHWLIYDARRNYGIYYDLVNICEVNLNVTNNENSIGLVLHEDEMLYQNLWRKYFRTTYNPARKNTKLHVQLLPKRYWKYLVEKSI